MTPPLYKPRPERWPQFSLRGLMVIVTLLCFWLGMQVKWIRDRHEALRGSNVLLRPDDYDGPAQAPWSIRIFGAKAVAGIDCPKDTRREERQEKMRMLRQLF